MRKCPICRWQGPKFTKGPNSEKFCPKCKSRSRHRHIWHALRQYKLAAKIRGAKILLVGGSQVEVNILNGASAIERMSYVNPNHGHTRLDLADMHPYHKGEFHFVFACHVLEHVQRLSQGLEEVHRVLKPRGSAIFCVPLSRREKSRFRERSDRGGHWWLIGNDWNESYEAAGFTVVTSSGRSCPEAFGVKPDNMVSVCTRK